MIFASCRRCFRRCRSRTYVHQRRLPGPERRLPPAIRSQAWSSSPAPTSSMATARAPPNFSRAATCRFALIEARQERAFLQRADASGCATPRPRVEGYNISGRQAGVHRGPIGRRERRDRVRRRIARRWHVVASGAGIVENARKRSASLLRPPRRFRPHWPGAGATAYRVIAMSPFAAVVASMFFSTRGPTQLAPQTAARTGRRVRRDHRLRLVRLVPVGRPARSLTVLARRRRRRRSSHHARCLGDDRGPGRLRLPRRSALPGFSSSIVKRLIGRARPFVRGDDVRPMCRSLAPGLCEPAVGPYDDRLSALVAVGALFPRAAVPVGLRRSSSRQPVIISAHYPSDVIAGRRVGALGAWWCATGSRAPARFRRHPRRRGAGPAGAVAGPHQKGCPDADRPIEGRGNADRPMTDANAPKSRRPAVSVVVPVRNEAGNVAPLVAEIAAAMAPMAVRDHLRQRRIDRRHRGGAAAASPPVSVAARVDHAVSCGQSAAVRSGACRRPARPSWRRSTATGRTIRPSFRRWSQRSSRAHRERRPRRRPAGRPQGHRLQEVAVAHRQCGARRGAARRHARYRLRPEGVPARRRSWRCPISTACIAFCRRWCGATAIEIGYVDVVDRPRQHGVSNYGMWDRLWVGILDLCGVWWLVRRKKRVPEVSEDLRDAR